MVCLGLEPGGGRMLGADESNELWRHHRVILSAVVSSLFKHLRKALLAKMDV